MATNETTQAPASASPELFDYLVQQERRRIEESAVTRPCRAGPRVHGGQLMSAQISIDFAAVNDNRADFDLLVLPLQDNLYGAAMRLTRNPTEAEDLVQDTLVRAFRFWHTFAEGTNVKAWVFTILRNTFINGYHRRGRKRTFQADVTAQMRSLGPGVAVGNTTSEPPGPDEVMAAVDTKSKIAAALAHLPDDYRRVVTLCDLEGLSYKEAAAEMKCPIGTVMSRLYRARKFLYGALKGHATELGLISESAPTERPSTRRAA